MILLRMVQVIVTAILVGTCDSVLYNIANQIGKDLQNQAGISNTASLRQF